MTRFIQVVTTVEKPEDAERIAGALVAARLAACVQITECKSVYRWQGAVTQANEYVLASKSRQDLFAALRQEIEKIHPYQVPEILAFPILDGNSSYLEWLAEQLRSAHE